jgi:hypothetical protein
MREERKGDSMTAIRKFVYTALLAATGLTFAPTLASAQGNAHGKFTLTHEVHWQNALVPAGDYRFSLESDGVAGVLTLSKISGASTGFLLMGYETGDANPSDGSRLLIDTTPRGTYVSAMQLPEFGMTLNFAVPAQATEKLAATAAATTTLALAK